MKSFKANYCIFHLCKLLADDNFTSEAEILKIHLFRKCHAFHSALKKLLVEKKCYKYFVF